MGVFRCGWLTLWLALAALLLPVAAAAAGPVAPSRFDRAEFAWAETSAAPASGWYRVRLALPRAPEQPLVLLLPRVVVTAQFILNDSALNADVHVGTDHGHIATPMPNRPHWVMLPPGLFPSGDDELLLRVRGNLLVHGGLSPFSVGDGPSLQGNDPHVCPATFTWAQLMGLAGLDFMVLEGPAG